MNEIIVAGEPLEKARFADFQPPPTSPLFWKLLPDAAVRFLQKVAWARPIILDDRCVKCGACVRICPAQAIAQSKSKVEISRKRCVACFCCTEVCPKNAINLQTSPLVALALKVRRLKHFLQGRA